MGNAIFFLGQKKKLVFSFGTTNENSLFFPLQTGRKKEPHFLLLQT
jgi:hypothetical protein